MKVLVTGGAGFVGSHLVDSLITRGDEVIIIDHHKRKKTRFPNVHARTYKVSITDPVVKTIFEEERPEAVCHLAAQISVTHSVEDPMHDANVNVIQSIPLVKYASENGCKKFVFASSGGAIYGDHPVLPTPELYNAHPISPYGVSKQTLERYLKSFYELKNLPYVALRFSNIYGPRQMMHGLGEGSVISIFLTKLLQGDPATIFGDGSATRDYLFVLDAVDAFVKALNAEFSGVVNISTEQETSVRLLWETLKKIHAKDHALNLEHERPGEIKRSVLCNTYAKEVLDWEPRTTLEQGLRETYDWFTRRERLNKN